jgi:hypothetical protein
MDIPKGLCQCGCGQKTKIAERNRARGGHVKGEPFKFATGHHHSRSGEKNHNWKGGRKTSSGYIRILLPDHHRADAAGYVREHILIAEKALGKPLPPGAVVHHHNEDGTDNKSPGNLVICQDNTYHMLLHQRMRAFRACGNANWRKCVFCKQYDPPEKLRIYRYKRRAHNTFTTLIGHPDCFKAGGVLSPAPGGQMVGGGPGREGPGAAGTEFA